MGSEFLGYTMVPRQYKKTLILHVITMSYHSNSQDPHNIHKSHISII